MNLTDAFLIHPVAMARAVTVLNAELGMLERGIGKAKRIEWLVAQREQLVAEAAIEMPLQMRPMIEAMSTHDVLRIFHVIRQNMQSIGGGSTFRHLRNAQRRQKLPERFIDNVSLQGCLMLLENDVEFSAVLQRITRPMQDRISSLPSVHASAARFKAIEESVDLATSKQARILAVLQEVLLESWDDIVDSIDFSDRDIAYARARILDQDIMLCLSAIVRVTGASVFDDMAEGIIAEGIASYQSIINALLNDRIYELRGDVQIARVSEAPEAAPQHHDVSAPSTENEMPELWSIEQTATYLGVTRVTVHRLLARGAITGVHVRRRHLVVCGSVRKYLDLDR